VVAEGTDSPDRSATVAATRRGSIVFTFPDAHAEVPDDRLVVDTTRAARVANREATRSAAMGTADVASAERHTHRTSRSVAVEALLDSAMARPPGIASAPGAVNPTNGHTAVPPNSFPLHAIEEWAAAQESTLRAAAANLSRERARERERRHRQRQHATPARDGDVDGLMRALQGAFTRHGEDLGPDLADAVSRLTRSTNA
jgi:hypothetical protein